MISSTTLRATCAERWLVAETMVRARWESIVPRRQGLPDRREALGQFEGQGKLGVGGPPG